MWEDGTKTVGTKITFVFESRMPIASERQYWVQAFLRSFTPPRIFNRIAEFRELVR